MKHETYVKKTGQREALAMDTLPSLPDVPTPFEGMVTHYRELQGVLASLEKTLLSCAVESQEERSIKETIAREVWDRDYVIFHTKNVSALSVLKEIAVAKYHDRDGRV